MNELNEPTDEDNRIFKNYAKIENRLLYSKSMKEKERAINYELGKNRDADNVVNTIIYAISLYCEYFWLNMPKEDFIKQRPSDNRLLSYISNEVTYLLFTDMYDYYNHFFVKWWLKYNWEKYASEEYDRYAEA